MNYRIVYVSIDGGNGSYLGEIITDIEAYKQASGSRNHDGLLESNYGETLFVPLDDNFPNDPECTGTNDDEDEDNEHDFECDCEDCQQAEWDNAPAGLRRCFD